MDKQDRAARKKHHIIYKTTCLLTGKYYIGMHSTDDLNDGYMGSGKKLWQSIKKHGAEQHMLEHLPSREALRLREAELVNEQVLKDKQCMNLTLGGSGGWDYHNVNPERKAVPSVKAQPRPRTAKMDAFMAKVHANPRYEVENVAASMSAALDVRDCQASRN